MNRTQTITAIIIHDSDGCNLKDTMHYVIPPDGLAISCIDTANKAPHVKDGSLHWQRDVSDFSLGIALIVSGEPDEKYNEKQFEALITLVTELARDYKIPLNRIVGHDMVEPANDPGESFPWFEFLNSVGTLVAQEDIAGASDYNGVA